MNKTSTRVLLTFAALALFVIPVAALAAGGTFTDDDTSIFEGDIEWMAANGITLGCNPPTNDRYCPDDAVTRGQMAAFMHRLGVNKVVDAKTAIDADKLDGSDSTAYRTVIAGVSCNGVDCVDTLLSNVELLELTITVPASGFLQLNSSIDSGMAAPTNDYVAVWMTLNGDTASFSGCETSFLGAPLGANRVEGSSQFAWMDGSVLRGNIATAPVVAVPAGTHTIRLCGLSNVAADTWSATVSATWSSEGSATILSAGALDTSDLPPGLVDSLQAAVDG